MKKIGVKKSNGRKKVKFVITEDNFYVVKDKIGVEEFVKNVLKRDIDNVILGDIKENKCFFYNSKGKLDRSRETMVRIRRNDYNIKALCRAQGYTYVQMFGGKAVKEAWFIMELHA